MIRPVGVLTVILLTILFAGAVEAKPIKGKVRHPPPVASDTTRLRDAQTAPHPSPDLLSGPAGPARPAPPASPPFPPAPATSMPGSRRVGQAADVGYVCRQTCGVKRSECIVSGASACDSAWSRCVIDCNLPPAHP